MIKIPVNLQDKIYYYYMDNIERDVETTEILKKFKDDFKKARIKDVDIIKYAKTIKQWKYRPPKRYQGKVVIENKRLLKKQQEQLNNNSKLLQEQVNVIKQKRSQRNNLENEIIIKKEKLEGYNQAMFFQKRAMYTLENIKCKIQEDNQTTIIANNNEDYTLFDDFIIKLTSRAISDLKSSSKLSEATGLLINLLKDNEKAVNFFMKQENNNNIDLTELKVALGEKD